jgi:hypothetical protein
MFTTCFPFIRCDPCDQWCDTGITTEMVADVPHSDNTSGEGYSGYKRGAGGLVLRASV